MFIGMSLHTSGAAPAFTDLSNKGLIIPSSGNGASLLGGGANNPYNGYLNSLKSIGFEYNGFWILPPNFQGWDYHFVFDKIIFSRHPREDPDTRMWRFSQYVPITQAPCGLLTEVVTGAIFQDSNYTVAMTDNEDNDYIRGNNFGGFDLINYISNILYKSIIEDANGYIVRLPKYSFTEQPEQGKVEVNVLFVNSKEIIFWSPDEFIFVKDGYGWYVNKQDIWRFSWDNEGNRFIAATEGFYHHGFGRLPISKAGGVWNPRGYWESYYYKAKPLMDDYLRSYSARQLIDKEASTPVIVEPNVDCPECSGRGQIQIPCENCPPEQQMQLHDCAGCHGLGKISRNPGEHLVLDREDFKAGVDIKFVNPDVEVNKNMRETCAELFAMIIEALHLSKVEEAQSGVAKSLDQERLHKFISGISNDLFDKIIPDTLRDISAYRNIQVDPNITDDDNSIYTIVKPTQFQIKTSEALLNEYKTATESFMPLFIRQKIALDYLDKEYSGDEVLKRKGSYIICTDPLAVRTAEEITGLTGVVTAEQRVYSEMISQWLDAIIETRGDEWFIDADDEMIATDVLVISAQFYIDNPTAGNVLPPVQVKPTANTVKESVA